jgi:hypothetical protein
VTNWTDFRGTLLEIGGGDGRARLEVTSRADLMGQTEPGSSRYVWLKPGDLAGVAVALYEAAGQPAPVIIPRPDVDPGTEYLFGPLRMRVSRARGVDLSAGNSSWHYDPSSARQAAGTLVALADAAGQEPDPGDVERLAVLVTGASRMAPEDAARYLLRAGVSIDAVNLPGEGGDRG